MHSKFFPPSGAEQWANCSAAPLAQLRFPNIETEETRNGDAQHWIIPKVIYGDISDCYEAIGKKAPNGVEITVEMAEGVQYIIDDVNEVMSTHPGGDLHVERRVEMPGIHDENYGTFDIAYLLPHKDLWFIWEYKGGHREVRPFENMQMMDYLNGIVEMVGPVDDTKIKVVSRVVQPFYFGASPIKEWYFTLSGCRPHWNKMHYMAHEAKLNPKMTSGPWCRDCRALTHCPTARKYITNILSYANDPYALEHMDNNAMVVQRKIIKDGLRVAKNYLEELEDTIENELKSGNPCGNLTIESTGGRVKWKPEINKELLEGVANQFNASVYAKSLKTPRQVVGSVNKSERLWFEQLIKKYTTKSGSSKLVERGDFSHVFKKQPEET